MAGGLTEAARAVACRARFSTAKVAKEGGPIRQVVTGPWRMNRRRACIHEHPFGNALGPIRTGHFAHHCRRLVRETAAVSRAFQAQRRFTAA